MSWDVVQVLAISASEESSLESISRTLRQPMDFRQLFKLRLVVAALGESQRLSWWNSGVLTGTEEFLFQQGFPRSAPFAQDPGRVPGGSAGLR